MRSLVRPFLYATSALVLAGGTAHAQDADSAKPAASANADRMAKEFKDPPMSARPRAWWHWMNGNITKDGIAKDLDWMKWVGLGGFQNFDANLSTPQIVDKRLVYMEPDWQDAFRFAGTRAEELGLEMAIAASPGWSETGGPWVPPQDGLKKLVWSETLVEGGKPFSGKLAPPPGNTGPFMDGSKSPGISNLMAGDDPSAKKTDPQFYDDTKVLAFPVAAENRLARPTVSLASDEKLEFGLIGDGKLATAIGVKRSSGEFINAIRLDYAKAQTVRSANLFMPGASAMFLGAQVAPELESSQDGESWTKVADITVTQVPTTISFAPVTARHFRLVLKPAPFGDAGFSAVADGIAGESFTARFAMVTQMPWQVAEFSLSGVAKVDHFEAKAGFEIEKDYYHLGEVDDNAAGIDPGQVIDITGKMRADGSLDWTPPAGSWKVLRLGYSLLGTTNHPATPEATGLEVDKFDGPAVRRYLEHYLGLYSETLGKPLVEQDFLDAILTDSIEVGAANWTPAMIANFTELRGYDPTPWLPAITGVIIGSRAQSDKFLYDYRRTLADLLSSEHYGTVAEVAHEHGLKVYGEALENGRPSLGDDMSMRSFADIPMSAMWTHSREEGPNPAHVYDMRGAASVAHLYGRKYVAAESMTSAMAPWDHHPGYLKRIIDLEFVNGVNRPVIHTSVHQPVDDKVPGLSLFIFGQYFNRHESWAPLARPWIDYLSRTSYLLQQGRNVADVAYFYGEDAPPAALYQTEHVPDAPTKYAWDFLNSDTLEDALEVKDGEIVSPGGARYKAIYLGGTSQMMTLPVLEKLGQLVREGATVIGMPPKATPSLADDADAFAALAGELWGGKTGAGKIIESTDVDGALAVSGAKPAFHFTGGSEDARIPFVEREWDGGRLFFLSNPGADAETIEARFRVTGKQPKLWDAVTGKASNVSYRIEGGETVIPLAMASDDALFVMFRKDTRKTSATVAAPATTLAGTIDSPWRVSFDGKLQTVAPQTMDDLSRLEENSDPAVKYFSGVATYANSFAAPAGWRAGKPLWLDLGEVHDLAEVWVNGQRVGGLWRAPWKVDIGKHAKAGDNTIEIKVANRWVNRLVGDAQEGAGKVTFTPLPTYLPTARLRPSGLVGPVQLMMEQ